MTQPDLAVRGQYLWYVAEQVRSHGGAVRPWLARHGVSDRQLGDPAFTVPFDVFRALVVDAIEVTGEPAFGLFVGQRLQANVHGALGYAALTSPSIRKALEVIERFVALRFPILSVTTEAHRGGARVRIQAGHMLGAIGRSIVETVAMAIKNVLDTISTGACRIARVSLAFRDEGYTALASELFGCEVRYGSTFSGFDLDAEALEAPLRMADPAAFHDAAQALQRELDRTESASLADRVRRLFFDQPTGFPSLDVTARVLHLSKRTLHRRLLDEGTSYRSLLEEARRSLAREYLRAGGLSIEQIAFALGYTDLANFRRAFHKWEGKTPAAYRAAESARASRAVRGTRRGNGGRNGRRSPPV